MNPFEKPVAIVGMGVCGKAFASALTTRTSGKLEVVCYDKDPERGLSLCVESNDQISEFRAVFVCVSTPSATSITANPKGGYDLSAVLDVLKILHNAEYSGDVVLRSTLTPFDVDYLQETLTQVDCKFRLHTMPEFLRAATAFEDARNPGRIIFGVCSEWAGLLTHEAVKALTPDHPLAQMGAFLASIFQGVPVQWVNARNAMLAKCIINSFLATKVVFMHEMYRALEESLGEMSSHTQAIWHTIIDLIKVDPRIGTSHMGAPGSDGKFGYGGACFPKDVTALYNAFKKSSKSGLPLLWSVATSNDHLRSDQG